MILFSVASSWVLLPRLRNAHSHRNRTREEPETMDRVVSSSGLEDDSLSETSFAFAMVHWLPSSVGGAVSESVYQQPAHLWDPQVRTSPIRSVSAHSSRHPSPKPVHYPARLLAAIITSPPGATGPAEMVHSPSATNSHHVYDWLAGSQCAGIHQRATGQEDGSEGAFFRTQRGASLRH